MFARRLILLLSALWVGSLWTIGYLVAPMLFATLADRSLAGTIAGSLFRAEAWISLVVGGILLAMQYTATQGRPPRGGLLVIGGMLLCTLVGYFGLQPYMAELRAAAGPDGVMASSVRTQFGLLHGASSAFYLLQSLLGAALLWKWVAVPHTAVLPDSSEAVKQTR